MARILILLAATFAALAASAARPSESAAAQMNYCETWADRVAENAPAARMDGSDRKAIRDKAFYECLNMDEEPPLPGNALGLFIDPSGSPFKALDAPPVETPPGAPLATGAADGKPADEEPVAQGDADEGDIVGSIETGQPVEDDGQGRGSGKPRGSQEWADFCARYYPNSFDRDTGTVVPVKLGRRVPCR